MTETLASHRIQVAADMAMACTRGAQFLDQHRPGWYELINLNTLSLESPCRCILGQLHPESNRLSSGISGYYVGLEKLVRPNADAMAAELGDVPLSEHYGFKIREMDYACDQSTESFIAEMTWRYGYLTQLWRDAIRARRTRSTE